MHQFYQNTGLWHTWPHFIETETCEGKSELKDWHDNSNTLTPVLQVRMAGLSNVFNQLLDSPLLLFNEV